ALIVAMGGLFAGIVLARHSVRPIEDLTAWLNRGNPTEPAPKNLPDAETRLLAGGLENYLLQRDRQLDRERSFLREASHELRNPISIIKGISELAEERSLSPEGLQRIQRSVQRMEHTVEGLLVLARQEQSIEGASLEHEWHSMLDEYREGFNGRIHDSATWGPIEPLAARMLVLMAGTLLRNVIDHAEADHVYITLTPEAFEIRDDGKGIEPLEPTLEALQRGYPLPSGGLGLALVSRICRRMEWSLTLKNTPGLRVEVRFQTLEKPTG
ncbi:MAG: HAMP domain-containing sensor histidine kinase, partial [Verrucomicrobiota bacterium]